MFQVHTPIIRSIRRWVAACSFLHRVYGKGWSWELLHRSCVRCRWCCAPSAPYNGCLISAEEPLIPSQKEVGWASQPVSVHCKKEKPFLLLGIKPRFSCHPVCKPGHYTDYTILTQNIKLTNLKIWKMSGEHKSHIPISTETKLCTMALHICGTSDGTCFMWLFWCLEFCGGP